MSIEDTFYQAVNEWKEHCRKPEVLYSSNIEVMLSCKAFKMIVELGTIVLPLVRKLYDEDDSKCRELSIIKKLGLVAVVSEIVTEEFTVPNEIRGRVNAMEDYTKRWLDENMHKYII